MRLQVQYLRENLGSVVNTPGELAFVRETIFKNVEGYLEDAMRPEFGTAVVEELADIAHIAKATSAFVDAGGMVALKLAVDHSETAGPATVLSIIRRFAVGVQLCEFAAQAANCQEIHQQAIAKMETLRCTQPGTVVELKEWDEYFNSGSDELRDTICTYTPEMFAVSEEILRSTFITLMRSLVHKWLSLFQSSTPGVAPVNTTTDEYGSLATTTAALLSIRGCNFKFDWATIMHDQNAAARFVSQWFTAASTHGH